MLTGKCLEGFEKWFESEFKEKTRHASGVALVLDCGDMFRFKDIPFSMQYGVYVDFFDKNGLYINIESESITEKPYWTYTIDYNSLGHDGEGLEYLFRPEVRKQAIIKANKIYNSI